MKNRIALVAVVLVVAASAAALGGCGKKTPQLTAEQLQAGVIGADHPVSQQDAMAQGCSCHLSQ